MIHISVFKCKGPNEMEYIDKKRHIRGSTLAVGLDFKEVVGMMNPDKETLLFTWGTSYAYAEMLRSFSNAKIYVGNPHDSFHNQNQDYLRSMLNHAAPGVEILPDPTNHVKALLNAPDFVCLTSRNLQDYGKEWLEWSLIFRDKQLYRYFRKLLLEEVEHIAHRQIPPWLPNTSVDKGCIETYECRSGTILRCSKLYTGKQLNWTTAFKETRHKDVTIFTYTIPDVLSAHTIIDQLMDNHCRVKLIANEQAYLDVCFLKRAYPGLAIAVRPNIHAKGAVIGGNRVLLTSENFGTSGMKEVMIGLKSRKANQYIRQEIRHFLEVSPERDMPPPTETELKLHDPYVNTNTLQF